MPRTAFRLRVKASAIETYERDHPNVWPELLAKLKEVGISYYSIFRRGQDLFLVMRVADFASAWRALGEWSREFPLAGANGRIFRARPRPATRLAAGNQEGSLRHGVNEVAYSRSYSLCPRRGRRPGWSQLRDEKGINDLPAFPMGGANHLLESPTIHRYIPQHTLEFVV